MRSVIASNLVKTKTFDIKLMDEKLDRANWGNSEKSNKWKTITDKSDNDASLHTDENQTFITDLDAGLFKIHRRMADYRTGKA